MTFGNKGESFLKRIVLFFLGQINAEAFGQLASPFLFWYL